MGIQRLPRAPQLFEVFMQDDAKFRRLGRVAGEARHEGEVAIEGVIEGRVDRTEKRSPVALAFVIRDFGAAVIKLAIHPAVIAGHQVAAVSGDYRV